MTLLKTSNSVSYSWVDVHMFPWQLKPWWWQGVLLLIQLQVTKIHFSVFFLLLDRFRRFIFWALSLGLLCHQNAKCLYSECLFLVFWCRHAFLPVQRKIEWREQTILKIFFCSLTCLSSTQITLYHFRSIFINATLSPGNTLSPDPSLSHWIDTLSHFIVVVLYSQ